MKDKFFGKLDWAAFWTATLLTFAVYFWTLGPSVGLEDSGELATAGAHLGVPHPPGYPFWTLCSWIFCKLFSWVSYMGHPTPAWAISLCSAVFGALAAGCTAMLICRSARDFLVDGANAPGRRKRRLQRIASRVHEKDRRIAFMRPRAHAETFGDIAVEPELRRIGKQHRNERLDLACDLAAFRPPLLERVFCAHGP
jgi:hypothetical protein